MYILINVNVQGLEYFYVFHLMCHYSIVIWVKGDKFIT